MKNMCDRKLKNVSAILVPLLCGLAERPAVAQAIADNSFLIEEAYNQERGVVQHISVWQRALTSAAWAFTFTQEWPLASQRHQLSYTLPVQRLESPSRQSGFGDVAVNYRYQLRSTARVAMAPRLSVLMPTGNAARGLGAGDWGAQVNLPLSVALGSAVVTHWNAGFTAVAGTTTYSAGASAIWTVRPTFNVLVEAVWAGNDGVGVQSFVVNPGIRWAHNFASGLQIVPGIAIPVGVGASRGETGALFYLSFEHRFRPEIVRD